MKKLRVMELFGGIGACSKALEKLGIDFEIADYVEIDKYAVKSFNAMHNTNFEPQDITKWNKYIEVDLIMHGSPCQDFSLAGNQAGGDKGTGTRSSLMYETIRIVEKLKPKYVIWENVKNLLSKKHRHNFDAYLQTMEQLGYTNYYQVLNAKDYGIPQNRERVFTVSILGDSNFEFPPKQELKLKLKDMLEDEVDDKYYLSDKFVDYICANNDKWTGNNGNASCINKSIASTITTREGCVRADVSNYVSKELPENLSTKEILNNNIYSKNSRIIKLSKKIITNNTLYMDIYNQKLRNDCGTLKAGMDYQQGNIIYNNLRIRKLTPKECWRLMGFDDSDFDKVEKVNSNTQLYKQAGNSICVNVLMSIFKQLFKGEE